MVALPPTTPLTDQSKVAFGLPATLAWNCCVAETKVVVEAGVTATEGGCENVNDAVTEPSM
jgi:hypothetical protein